MRSITLVVLAALLGACAEEGELVPVQAPNAPTAAVTRDAQDGCFPRTLALLEQADVDLARGATADAKNNVRVADAAFATEDRIRSCPVDAHERVNARKLVVRGLVARETRASDLDVLLSLGDEAFDASDCKDELALRCTEHLSWLRARFPNFVTADEVRVVPLFRLPYTPQPDGRFTVEYMTYVQRRIDALPGDVFALSLEPSGTAAVDAEPLGSLFDLRVDGADVVETSEDCASASGVAHVGSLDVAAQGSLCPKERKAGAHLTTRVPSDDMLRAKGTKALVVLVNRQTFARSGSSWRATGARVAYGED